MLLDQYKQSIADVVERTRQQYEKDMSDLQDASERLMIAQAKGEPTAKLEKAYDDAEKHLEGTARKLRMHNEQTLWDVLRSDSSVREEAKSEMESIEAELDAIADAAEEVLVGMGELMAEYVEQACLAFKLGQDSDDLRAQHRELHKLLPDAKPARGYHFRLHELPKAEDLHAELYGRGRKPRPAPAPKDEGEQLFLGNDHGTEHRSGHLTVQK